MVSFQCHTCSDVVKKPKLDQHRSRCHGGFDCIDCSTTFNTPAEYKGHTSCISEAEKYQKSLFRGPKKGGNGQSNNDQTQPLPPQKGETIDASVSRQSNAQWNRIPHPTSLNNVNGYSGPQHMQRRQPQLQWQNGWNNSNDRYTNGRGRPPRPSASGANDTPLGTPRRTLTVGFGSLTARAVEPNADTAGRVDRTLESVSPQIEKKQNPAKVEKKAAKEDAKGKPDDLKLSENKVDSPLSVVEEKPGKKDKKKKSKRGESEMVTSNKGEDMDAPPEMERHKKKRKEKEEKRTGKDSEFRTEDVEMASPPKKEKKGKRKDNKQNGQTESNEERATIIGDIEMAEPVKREKKRKEKDINVTTDSIEGEVEIATGKERRRREKDSSAVKTDHDRDLDAEANRKGNKKRKLQEDFESKKKKRKEKTKDLEDI